jgi:hypothetical protein
MALKLAIPLQACVEVEISEAKKRLNRIEGLAVRGFGGKKVRN